MEEYYVYQYVREDGSPYYIGKGKGRRAYATHPHIAVPKDRSRIQFIREHMTEPDALELEIQLIALYGRKSVGDGILRNLTAGGEGTSGITLSEDHKRKISEANKGKKVPTVSRSSLEGYIMRYGAEDGQRLYDEQRVKKDSMSLDAFIKRFGEIEGPVKYQARQHEMSERMAGENHPLFGVGHTEATRQKISASKTGKKIARSAEHNAKIGAANKGKKPPMDTCIHCGMRTSTTNIKRWHNDNCKHK